jgi:tryptophan-rich sensory protein
MSKHLELGEEFLAAKKPDRSRSRNLFALVGWLLLSFTASGVGSIASVNARNFYQALERPSWAPPGWLFGPVWTTLFALMGIAAWLVWRERGWRYAQGALALFIVQLGVNALWSWLFFAWRMGTAAIVDVLLLWLLIVATLVAFWRVKPLAGMLLVPYLVWVTYATALTIWIVQRNSQAL